MARDLSRRRFLERGCAGSAALLGLSDLSFLSAIPPVSASEAAVPAKAVEMRPEIEPLVRLLEDTPRERLLEEVASRIRRGLSYREVLAALQLAGVRNIQPRPSVGFKFHAVLVVNSAHLASLASPPAERWLPIFWALDYFKSSQARDVREGNWTMAPVKESLVPPAHKAREKFIESMESWDEYGADAAVAGLARTAGVSEIYELFWRYGMRDFRSIGHKAIFVANSFRTLACIGWRHGEPVLRSLAYALQNHQGEDNPAKSDLAADRPWRRNVKLAAEIRPDWRGGKPDGAATNALLEVLRQGSDEDASRKVVELLGRGVAPASLWDAFFAAAGEMLLRQAGIISLHAATTANALHFAYATSASDETRRLVLLQCAAFLTMFRDLLPGRGKVRDVRIDGLEPQAPGAKKDEALAEIFQDATSDRHKAVRKALAFLGETQRAKELIDAARLLVFLKGNDAHDYKFSSAVLEDYFHVTPAWRDRFLASSISLLCSSGEPDNKLVKRTREALGSTRTF